MRRKFKIISMVRQITIFCFIVVFFVTANFADEASDIYSPFKLNLNPSEIEIGMFYNGSLVEVSAEVPECDGAVLIMEAGPDDIILNKKGRFAGVWMNVAQVTAENVPEVYFLGMSDKLNNICSPNTAADLHFGAEYLKRRIQFISDLPLTGSEFNDFLRLKMNDGMYNMNIFLRVVFFKFFSKFFISFNCNDFFNII